MPSEEESPDQKTDGYHGTYLENAVKIIKEGFKITPNENHYWGDGVYYYESESAEKEAIKWAKDRQFQEKAGKLR